MVQDHTENKQQGQDLNPVSLVLDLMLLSITLRCLGIKCLNKYPYVGNVHANIFIDGENDQKKFGDH